MRGGAKTAFSQLGSDDSAMSFMDYIGTSWERGKTAATLRVTDHPPAAEPGLTTVACVQAVQEKFGITVHRRSLERALASKKKPRNPA
jgi:hypothetical protein